MIGCHLSFKPYRDKKGLLRVRSWSQCCGAVNRPNGVCTLKQQPPVGNEVLAAVNETMSGKPLPKSHGARR